MPIAVIPEVSAGNEFFVLYDSWSRQMWKSFNRGISELPTVNRPTYFCIAWFKSFRCYDTYQSIRTVDYNANYCREDTGNFYDNGTFPKPGTQNAKPKYWSLSPCQQLKAPFRAFASARVLIPLGYFYVLETEKWFKGGHHWSLNMADYQE